MLELVSIVAVHRLASSGPSVTRCERRRDVAIMTVQTSLRRVRWRIMNARTSERGWYRPRARSRRRSGACIHVIRIAAHDTFKPRQNCDVSFARIVFKWRPPLGWTRSKLYWSSQNRPCMVSYDLRSESMFADSTMYRDIPNSAS